MIEHWKLVFVVVGLFLMVTWAEEAKWLIFLGEERTATVVEASPAKIRECGRKDILCALHLSDSYVPGFSYRLKIDDFIVSAQNKENISVGAEIPVMFNQGNPELVHVIGANYHNVYISFFGGLFLLIVAIAALFFGSRPDD